MRTFHVYLVRRRCSMRPRILLRAYADGSRPPKQWRGVIVAVVRARTRLGAEDEVFRNGRKGLAATPNYMGA
jgi:hypothetical protein